MKDLFSLNGKIAVVTGAYGLLGQNYCLGLSAFGARVVALDVVEKPKKFAPGMDDLLGDRERFLGLTGDITQKSDVETALEKIRKHWGEPAILVNNAAIDSPPSAPVEENGPFEQYPIESLEKMFAVNVKGTWICCQVFGGAMAMASGGSIINIASIYGLVSPNQALYEYRRAKGESYYKPASYSVTKSALLNLTRYLATYWGKKSVRVNTLTPSGIFNQQDEAFMNAYCELMPMGRMARPDEMNGALIFLASNASSYVTGSNLIVDGGWTAW